MNKNESHKSFRALMLEATYYKKAWAGMFLASLLFACGAILSLSSIPADEASASDTANATFQINVQDSIAVAVTTPSAGATGNINEFLRNTVVVDINTNVANGFTASMYSRDDTNLTHTMLGSSYYIPTVSSSTTRGAFPVNNWGYSLKNASNANDGRTYGETDAGNQSSNYYPLTTSTATPITILKANSGTKSGVQSVYFGAKANAEKPAGTYLNTVIISVVTGTIEENSSDPGYNPITPTDPATPNTDVDSSNTVATYTGANSSTGTGISGHNGTTVNTVRTSTSNTNTTTTEVSAGDNRASYAPAQGVTVTTQTNITESGSSLPIGLAATAVTAATAGIIFFILAKRDEDDDEDDDEEFI